MKTSGWTGRILRIDLSKRKATEESSSAYTPLFIGGRGVGVKLVFNEVGPETSPLDPGNRLVLSPGVLTGSSAPATARMKLTTVCPNGLLASSGIGGSVGFEIKQAGYDNVIIQGRLDEPFYLYINDDRIEFRDARHLWGKDTCQTEKAIKSAIGDPDVAVMSIGPAGENMVGFASIATGTFSTAGRGGFGAIMGSKNLKAIAVRGKRGIGIARMEEYLDLSLKLRNLIMAELFRETSVAEAASPRLNAAVSAKVREAVRLWTYGNWEGGVVDSDAEGYTVPPMELGKYVIGKVGCSGCPKYHYYLFDVPGVGIGAPKCNGLTSFGPGVWNSNQELVFEAATLCNRYGLDAVSTGNIVSFLMELSHRGIITEKDTDGVSMKRGDRKAILTTIEKIALQEGFGKLFLKGVLEAARAIGRGAEECAMQVKGIEMQQPSEFRAIHGMALANAVCTRDVHEAMPDIELRWFAGERERPSRLAQELYGNAEAIVCTGYQGKALLVWDYENRKIISDVLGICNRLFPWHIPSADIPARLLSLAIGADVSQDDLILVAQRVRTLERAQHVTRGIKRKDDTLPKRIFETSVPIGPYKGQRLDKVAFDKMVGEYYRLAGWDEDGIPVGETFHRLGLNEEWRTFQDRMSHTVPHA